MLVRECLIETERSARSNNWISKHELTKIIKLLLSRQDYLIYIWRPSFIRERMWIFMQMKRQIPDKVNFPLKIQNLNQFKEV